jgi:hypothetical protein
MKPAIAMLLVLLLPAAATAQIYRWEDENGVIHFSQNKPSHGPYTDVTPKPDPPIPGASSAHRHSTDFIDTTTDSHDRLLQARADDAERCAKARERISFLEEKTAHRLTVTGADGEPARMTDEQFADELNDAKSAAAKYCD